MREFAVRQWCYSGYLWLGDGVNEGSVGRTMVLLRVVAVSR